MGIFFLQIYMKKEHIFTPYLDGNADRITAGDTLIIGDNPANHEEWEVKYDYKLETFTASRKWDNKMVFTMPLSKLDEEKKSEWYIK